MGDSVRTKNSKARAKIRAAKAAKNIPIAILLSTKAACDAKALKIVEMMTETNIDVDWMLQNLNLLNRSHMEDVVEERAIIKLCGYPLCDNPLTKIIKSRYQISAVRNKVYDIQKTKNFCSHRCYLSTEYLMKQMLTSPLWLREEEEKPTFKILEKIKERGSSPPGVEVKLVTLELPSDDSDESETPEKSSVQSMKSETIETDHKSSKRSFETQVDDKNEDNTNKNDKKIMKNETSGCKKIKKTVSFGKNEIKEFEAVKIDDKNIYNDSDSDDDGWIEFRDDENLYESMEKMVIDDKNEENIDMTMKEDKIDINKTTEKLPIEEKNNINSCEKLEKKYKTNRKSRKQIKQKEQTFETLVSHVEKSFTEWVTEETSALLYGEPSLKQQAIDKISREEKLNNLCKKLDLIQIEEEKEARMLMKKSTDMKPVPNFETLKEESKNIELKVKAFYKGKTDISDNLIIENKIENKNDNADDAFLPLTDAHDAVALRRGFFLNNLNRVVPDLLQTLSGPGNMHFVYGQDRRTMIKALVSTFKLSASNIVFKSPEWNLVALLIIKMMCAIDPKMKSLLATEKASKHMSMILTIYNLSPNYLDILISSVTAPITVTN